MVELPPCKRGVVCSNQTRSTKGYIMGKGSKPRPLGIDLEEFDKHWDLIFGKKEPIKEEDSEQETTEVEEGEKILT